MKKIKFSFYFVFLGFLTLTTGFFLLVQRSYFNFKKPQDLVENNVLLKDFNPNLDLTVVSEIESREGNTDESFDFSILTSNKPTEEASQSSQEATTSASEIKETNNP